MCNSKISTLKAISDKLSKIEEICNLLDGSRTIRLEVIEPLDQHHRPCPQKGFRLDADVIENLRTAFEGQKNDLWEELRNLTIEDENDFADAGAHSGSENNIIPEDEASAEAHLNEL